MEKSERIKLIRALTKASNRFHESLKSEGYDLSYSLLDTQTGSILDANSPSIERWPLGTVTISWSIKK